jgi:hypothetical protein
MQCLAGQPVLARPENCPAAKEMSEVRLDADFCVPRMASVVEQHLNAALVFRRH